MLYVIFIIHITHKVLEQHKNAFWHISRLALINWHRIFHLDVLLFYFCSLTSNADIEINNRWRWCLSYVDRLSLMYFLNWKFSIMCHFTNFFFQLRNINSSYSKAVMTVISIQFYASPFRRAVKELLLIH